MLTKREIKIKIIFIKLSKNKNIRINQIQTSCKLKNSKVNFKKKKKKLVWDSLSGGIKSHQIFVLFYFEYFHSLFPLDS